MPERRERGGCLACCLRGFLWGLVPLMLVVAGAWLANRGVVEETVRRDVEAALHGAGFDWAGVEVRGRDVLLTGAAPARAVAERAAAAALAVPGVRRVDTRGVEIRPGMPTVQPLTVAKGPVILRGTWPAAPGTELSVTVAGTTHVAGRSSALTVSDGRWTLRLDDVPPDGVYEVEVTVRDGAITAHDATRHELVVDTTPPARPEIESINVQGRAVQITGTWPVGDARSLVVVVDGKVWKLGDTPQLTASGEHWRLNAGDLPEGTHDVTVTVEDAVGNTASLKRRGAVVVDTTPPPPARVDAVRVDGRQVTVKGHWPAREAKVLVVTLAGRSYWLGDSPELAARGDSWRLKVTHVPEGVHDIVVAVTDTAGNRTETRREGMVKVDVTPPPPGALTVESVRVDNGVAVIAGGWPEGDAVSLAARLGSRTFHLGAEDDFRRTGAGRWRLRARLPGPGRYDLTLIQRDAAGNESARTFAGIVEMPVPKPAPRPVPETAPIPPADGEATERSPHGDAASGGRDRARPAATRETTVDSVPPAPATVPRLVTNNRRPTVGGVWPADDAVSLEVALDGRILTPRPGGPLTVSGNLWRLRPAQPLAEGIHPLRVTVRDAAGNVTRSEGRIVVDTTSPAPPTVRPSSTQERRPTITGTWPADDAVSLEVAVAGRRFLPTADGPLTVDGDTWRLVLPEPLSPGAYDIRVTVRDAAGNVSHDQTVNELVIKAPPRIRQPESVAASLAGNDGLACQQRVEARLRKVRILFESDSERIRARSRPLIAEIARILNTCPKTKVLVAGHTDATGSATYNQALSERRAAAVARALIAEGVSPTRLEVVGFGEARPIADNDTRTGRARNRRIEFVVRRSESR